MDIGITIGMPYKEIPVGGKNDGFAMAIWSGCCGIDGMEDRVGMDIIVFDYLGIVEIRRVKITSRINAAACNKSTEIIT